MRRILGSRAKAVRPFLKHRSGGGGRRLSQSPGRRSPLFLGLPGSLSSPPCSYGRTTWYPWSPELRAGF